MIDKLRLDQEQELVRVCTVLVGTIFEDSISDVHGTYAIMSEKNVDEICTGQAKRSGLLINVLYQLGMWPGSVRGWKPENLDEAVEEIRDVGKVAFGGLSPKCSSPICGSCSLLWGEVILEELQNFESRLHGLCLKCVRLRPDDTVELVKKKCREHNAGFNTSSWFLPHVTFSAKECTSSDLAG